MKDLGGRMVFNESELTQSDNMFIYDTSLSLSMQYMCWCAE
jgi:hypothetical protein